LYYRCGLRQALAYKPGRILLAFNVNVDAVRHAKQGELDALELPRELTPLRECAATGEQREVYVSRSSLEFLIENLGYDFLAVGGQCGQAALAASQLGVTSYLHLAERCRAVGELLDERVLVAGEEGFLSVKELDGECSPAVHFVIELKKGEVHFGTPVPENTRFIASWDPAGEELRIDATFVELIRGEIRGIPKGMISGFHLTKPERAGRIREVERLIEEWRELNPELFLHLELAQYRSERVLSEVRRRLFPLVDSVGFDRAELRQLTGEAELIPALEEVSGEVERAVLHCSSYALCLSDDYPKQVKAALQFGSLLASFRARHGRLPSMAELQRFSPPKPCRAGIEARRELMKHRFEKGLVVVPALYVEEPEATVGLGDTFALGFTLVA
jgi:ADP-dependent phosphofructokinase/glucokinase